MQKRNGTQYLNILLLLLLLLSYFGWNPTSCKIKMCFIINYFNLHKKNYFYRYASASRGIHYSIKIIFIFIFFSQNYSSP
jgi:hypothetical protein